MGQEEHYSEGDSILHFLYSQHSSLNYKAVFSDCICKQ